MPTGTHLKRLSTRYAREHGGGYQRALVLARDLLADGSLPQDFSQDIAAAIAVMDDHAQRVDRASQMSLADLGSLPEHDLDRAMFWYQVLGDVLGESVGRADGLFAAEVSLPAENPTVTVATLGAPDLDWRRLDPERLARRLGVAWVALSPVGEMDTEGKEVPATDGGMGFRVWVPLVEAQPVHLPQDPWLREAAARSLMPSLRTLLGWPSADLAHLLQIMREDSEAQAIDLRLWGTAGMPMSRLYDALPQIQHLLGVEQVLGGFLRSSRRDDLLTIRFGDRFPVYPDRPRFVNPHSVMRKQQAFMEWGLRLHRAGVGDARLLEGFYGAGEEEWLTFALPPGAKVDLEDLQQRLSAAMGMEVVAGMSETGDLMVATVPERLSGEERRRARSRVR